MPLILNEKAFAHVTNMLLHNFEVNREEHNWTEHKPTAEEENRYLNTHTYEEYGLWYLAINTDAPENSKERYEFPYGDFNLVFKSALIAIEKRAQEYKHSAIAQAARDLLTLLNSTKNS